MRSSHVVLDTVDVAFDDDHAVAAAGLLLPATLASGSGSSSSPTSSLIWVIVRARPGPVASCSPWSTRCSPVAIASTTSRRCGPGRPARSSATA